MNRRLPNEIISHISKLVGEESTLDLKPFVLVNHQWHATAAPTLLAAISITSLGRLVELCDQIILYQRDGTTSRSTIAKHTKSIIVSGAIIIDGSTDSHLGLDDLGQQPRGENEGLEEDSIQADIEMEPGTIRNKLRVALSQLVLLSGFEWYGRFAGDYYLARYLQQSKTIQHLAYGIDMFVSSVSLAYREHAFNFEGLKTLAVTSEHEPSSDLFVAIARMMHRNPDLRSILFDCKYAESMSGNWSLIEFICDTSSPNKPIFVWSNLSHLVLRFWNGRLWHSTGEVALLVRFLVAHPKLRTLVLQEKCIGDVEDQTAKPFSLAKHSDSLPALKRLLGSPRLIAGVLESQAACSSVERVIDNSEEGFDSEVKIPYIDRILDALENVPGNQIQRLRLEIPQLNRNIYSRIAQLAPKIRFLEFLCSFELDSTSPKDSSFDPLIDIPSGLNEFPNLRIIGRHIAKDFARAFGGHEHDGIIELARQVPRIAAVHALSGNVMPIHRHSSGEVSIEDSPRFLDNADYDWITFAVDWRHRVISQRQLKGLRGLDNSTKLEYDFI